MSQIIPKNTKIFTAIRASFRLRQKKILQATEKKVKFPMLNEV